MNGGGFGAVTALALMGLIAACVAVGRQSTSAVRPGWDAGEPTGQHRRIETPNGPVHLFVPTAYDARTAGTVLYVHGYFSDVDQAWKQHELASQFAASGRNALFIVCEAPVGGTDAVRWQTLSGLLEAVTRVGEIDVPAGPAVLVAHSGGWRTMQGWLAAGGIDTVLLLDGLYGAEAELTTWLANGGNHAGSLVLVGSDTASRTEKFIEAFPDTVTVDQVPPPDRARDLKPSGRLLFMRSQYGHMEIVTEGNVIPSVLQLTPLAAVNGPSAS